MSDFIPFDIQLEIIKRLPIKSLLRFQSVSKPWKSFIDNPKFINDHASNHNHPHNLLVRYNDDQSETKYVSILDNDSFPKHKFPITPPESLKLIIKPNLLYSSHGLFCFYNFYGNVDLFRMADFVTNQTVVVWNPSIRKSVDIVVPNVLTRPYKTLIGFGVCPHTLHFKLVKVSYFSDPFMEKFSINPIPNQVEVYTSSSGRGWRSPLCINNLPRKNIAFNSNQVVIDGFIYWLAYDFTLLFSTQQYLLIMSFDMTSEKFTEISFPDGIQRYRTNYISKLNDSLVLIDSNTDRKNSYVVWKMDRGTSKTFSKLYTISTPEASVERVLGFRKSSEPIIEMCIDSSEKDALFVYKHNSNHIYDIGISGKSISMISYVKTLLLLDY